MIPHRQRSELRLVSPASPRRDPAQAAHRARGPLGRRGISLIETQIAFVVLAIGVAGLCPIVTMNYRHLANLEGNMDGPLVSVRDLPLVHALNPQDLSLPLPRKR